MVKPGEFDVKVEDAIFLAVRIVLSRVMPVSFFIRSEVGSRYIDFAFESASVEPFNLPKYQLIKPPIFWDFSHLMLLHKCL